MSFDFGWCRCGEHIWPHWHVNPDDPHEIKILGEGEDDDDEDAG